MGDNAPHRYSGYESREKLKLPQPQIAIQQVIHVSVSRKAYDCLTRGNGLYSGTVGGVLSFAQELNGGQGQRLRLKPVAVAGGQVQVTLVPPVINSLLGGDPRQMMRSSVKRGCGIRP